MPFHPAGRLMFCVAGARPISSEPGWCRDRKTQGGCSDRSVEGFLEIMVGADTPSPAALPIHDINLYLNPTGGHRNVRERRFSYQQTLLM